MDKSDTINALADAMGVSKQKSNDIYVEDTNSILKDGQLNNDVSGNIARHNTQKFVELQIQKEDFKDITLGKMHCVVSKTNLMPGSSIRFVELDGFKLTGRIFVVNVSHVQEGNNANGIMKGYFALEF